jgi:iron complex outermembrane receptor protein
MSLSPSKALPSVTVIAAVAIALAAPAVRAQQVAQSADSEVSLQEVIVTGTRQTGIQAADSAAPIQIISSEALVNAGSPDLMTALSTLVPSFVVQGFGGDMANQTIQARLRGLSPNHVLVLIDGKRRHTTANLGILQSSFQGGAGADLSFIPISAIDHVEVLTEGAAAQYGSDAIAGVINIILKKNSSGGSANTLYGANFDGGGQTTDTSANAGFAPLDDSTSYFNVTGEIKNHAHTQRGNVDPNVATPLLATYPEDAQEVNAEGYPYLNRIQGDAEQHLKLASYNAGFTFPGDVEFYSFGTYGHKEANSYENYREPHKAVYVDPTTGVTSYLYPFGYDPQEQLVEEDYQLTAGLKGAIAAWNWDLASEYGEDHDVFNTIDSANNSYYAAFGYSPKNFHDGNFITTQWTTTLDFNHDFDIGMAGPLNVAFGGEYRKESYQITPGDPLSYEYSGAASFAGYQPINATDKDRKNEAGYIDLAGKPIANLQVDLAGRYEHFSDFGNTTVGKFTARYDFTPEFAVRATVSNGFRAPTLAEEYYTGLNVGPTTANGQLAPNAAGSALLGLGGGLKPEKSDNYSLGIVFRPLPGLTATLDIYDIEVRNRIVGTGNLNGIINGVPVPGAGDILLALKDSGLTIDPSVSSVGINLFANGINTRTKGTDFVLSYPQDYVWGHVDWSLGATYNETTITSYVATTPELGGQPLFNPTAFSDLTTTSPKIYANFGGVWTLNAFSVSVKEFIYGPTSEWDSDNGDLFSEGKTACPAAQGSFESGGDCFFNTRIGTLATTNLELGLQAMKGLKIAIGANNLFNRYPTQQNANLVGAYYAYTASPDNSAVTKYPGFSPVGIDGGFYYARASFHF